MLTPRVKRADGSLSGPAAPALPPVHPWAATGAVSHVPTMFPCDPCLHAHTHTPVLSSEGNAHTHTHVLTSEGLPRL